MLKKLITIKKTQYILCPFHKEKTPSCFVQVEKNFFFCFGCKKHGKINSNIITNYTKPLKKKNIKKKKQKISNNITFYIKKHVNNFYRKLIHKKTRTYKTLPKQ